MRCLPCNPQEGKPFLGICLGLQLLFDGSEENGGCEGLGVIPGQVTKFDTALGLPVPHIGWNDLQQTRPSTLLSAVGDQRLYFVHSYRWVIVLRGMWSGERYVVLGEVPAVSPEVPGLPKGPELTGTVVSICLSAFRSGQRKRNKTRTGCFPTLTTGCRLSRQSTRARCARCSHRETLHAVLDTRTDCLFGQPVYLATWSVLCHMVTWPVLYSASQVSAMQFHPEKSGTMGLNLLQVGVSRDHTS